MKLIKLDFFSLFLIFIITSLFVLSLFLFPGRPATFDANTHISTFTQFSQALKAGDFPVVWLNNFANYGLPVGIVTHQLTNYFGAVITFATSNPVTTYNILVFIAILFTNIFLYFFLRLYFSPVASLLGTFVYCFTPYRIFNIYVRGAMPEVFSGIFLPLILTSMYLFLVRKKIYGLFLLVLSIALLTLNHPMMLVVYSVIFIPYLIYLILSLPNSNKVKLKAFVISLSAIILGVLLCSYYVLPLNLESKYFYNGLADNHLSSSGYLSVANFLVNKWGFFSAGEILTREHVPQFGLFETLILAFGLLFFVYKKFIERSKENLNLLKLVLIMSVLIIFFTTRFADIFFQNIFFLNSIQFPSRFLSALIFLPAILIAFFYNKFPKKIIYIAIVIVVAIFSFPQVYGKNYMLYPENSYFYSKENLYSIMMNTIWSGRSQDYPGRAGQIQIVEGKGVINNERVFNSKRTFDIDASTRLKLVDYTFYFPGWNLYVDSAKSNIEFQDPKYRGVITYVIPEGRHSVLLAFQDTKVRFLGKIMSIASALIFAFLFFLRKRIKNILKLTDYLVG